MSSLMQYLIQQSHEFHERVDELDETIGELTDKIAVIEYNILKELRLVRQEIDALYEEDTDEGDST